MNVNEYIHSGVVESYVLGLASESEQQDFEQMCAAYPEVAAARDAFERLLEAQLLQDAAPVPAMVKEKVMAQIGPPLSETVLTDMTAGAPVRRLNVWKWVAAASLLLMAGAGYWAFTANKKYNDLLARQDAMEQQLAQASTHLQTLQQDAEILKHPMKTVSLKGTDVAPQAQTTVFWDTTGAKKEVYLLVNNLPQPPSNKQYQLWALLDGKPIDLGYFDVDVQQRRLLVKMKNVQNAQAFAITLEQRNRPNPDVPSGQMYVVGKL